MEEIVSMKVTLPSDDTPVNFPEISIELELDEDSQWTAKTQVAKVVVRLLH